MEENAAAVHTAINSVQALGRGFDVNFDTRLLYCKGVGGSRVVEIDSNNTKDLWLYDNLVVPNVSRDIKNSQGTVRRESSGVFSFLEMAEYFNKKVGLSGDVPLGSFDVPLGSFNAAFSYTGSKSIDAAATKTLSMDGFFIPLAKVQLVKTPLVLQENVKQAVPTSWDPPSLASFIENFGTHLITSGAESSLFNSQGIYPQPSSAPYLTGNGKEDVTVIFRRRGGDDLEQSHSQWAKTVRSSPDVIEMSFYPITLLLEGLTGNEHLVRAVDLYLEHKPQIEELRYFLEFQVPRVWAPVQDTLPGHRRKEPVCPSLQFSMMGQKLYISQEQCDLWYTRVHVSGPLAFCCNLPEESMSVSVGRKPVTGLRLCLEGSKQNRLCIHLQHLTSLPKILQPFWDTHVAIGAPKWQGPEEQDSRWFEPVKWKKYSHVSTAPIESPATFIGDFSDVYIVTGAQLGVWEFGSVNVLYMKLLYSRLPGCTVRRSLWDHSPDDNSRKVVPSGNNNGDSSSGSREVIAGNKLAKFVDMAEMTKGPQDSPGHWLVTGGKLGVEKGKIVLRVKYSLLNY
ncbi:hypothetical protein RHGRI_015648 [Rhododendron griersonianum]|uniref:MACPF domain-containing protein n=1 Tax=Rhododendron griersonianum TaxID=479676 RepID=A0AAV6KE27_9ERIC|nr:hypothetical protein RHGRI_015648 [Rhododendron griersonianum]